MSTIRLKVFISSVQKEMRTERAAVGGLLATDPFLSRTAVPRLFEEYPAPLRPNKRGYLELLAEIGGRAPSFELIGDEFTVTLYGAAAESEPAVAPASVEPIRGQPVVAFPGNERQQEIIRVLEAQGWVSSGVVVQKLGIVKDTAVRDLNEMIDAGFLRKEGTGRGTRYFPTDAARGYFSSDNRPIIGRKSDDSRTKTGESEGTS